MNTSLQDMVSVYNAQGRLEGEMIKAFLEANGIDAILTQESAASVYGISVGVMGIVEVLVAPEDTDAALSLLASMERGDFLQSENPELDNEIETDEDTGALEDSSND